MDILRGGWRDERDRGERGERLAEWPGEREGGNQGGKQERLYWRMFMPSWKHDRKYILNGSYEIAVSLYLHRLAALSSSMPLVETHLLHKTRSFHHSIFFHESR